MAINLLTKKVVESTIVDLVDAAGDKLVDDKGNVAQIEVYGKGSEVYKKALSALNRKNIARKGKTQTLETSMEDNAELLATISKAAYNIALGDKEIETFADFKELYSIKELYFIRDAVSAALEDDALFMKA